MKKTHNDNVHYFTSSKQLTTFSIILKSTLNIKLSSAQKALATALNIGSFNELLDYIKEHKRLGNNHYNFITNIKDHLINRHQIELSQTQETKIAENTISIEKLLKKTSFVDFYRFALVHTNQNIPMHSLCDQEVDYGVVPIPFGNGSNLDKDLHHYLLTDEIADSLQDGIKKLLKYTRAQTKYNGIYSYRSNTGGRFEVSKVLKVFKEIVIFHSNPNPVFYYCSLSATISEYGYFPDDAQININNTSKEFTKHYKIMIGEVAVPLHEFISEYHEDGKEVTYKHPFQNFYCWEKNYSNTIYFDALTITPLKYNKQSKEILNNYNGCYITLFKNQTGYIRPFEANLFEGDIESDNQIQIGVLPIIALGKPLSKNQVALIQKGLPETDDVFFSELFNINEINTVYEESEIIALKTGEVIGKTLRKHPESTIEFSQMKHENYTTITETEMKNPYGFDGRGMASRYFGNYYGYGKEGCSATSLEYIAIGSSKVLKNKISILDTYTDNFEKYKHLGFDEDGLGLYFSDNECYLPLFEVDSDSLKYFQYEDGFENQLPFEQCHNVYIITQSDGLVDDRHFIAGYTKDGECIINGVYTPFLVNNYMCDDWLRIFKTYKDINNKISGNLLQYDDEMVDGSKFCYDGQSEGLMLLNETDFIKKYYFTDHDQCRASVEVTISIKKQNKENITNLQEIEEILEQSPSISLERRKDVKEVEVEKSFNIFGSSSSQSNEVFEMMTEESIEYFHHIKKTDVDHVFSAQTPVINYKEHLTRKQKHQIEIGNKKYMLYLEVKNTD